MALNSRGCIIRQSEVDVVPAVRPRTSSSREPVKAISPLKTKASHMCGRRFFCAWHLQANAMPATIGIPIPTRREEEQASSITIATCWKYDLQGCRAERLKLWGVPATHYTVHEVAESLALDAGELRDGDRHNARKEGKVCRGMAGTVTSRVSRIAWLQWQGGPLHPALFHFSVSSPMPPLAVRGAGLLLLCVVRAVAQFSTLEDAGALLRTQDPSLLAHCQADVSQHACRFFIIRMCVDVRETAGDIPHATPTSSFSSVHTVTSTFVLCLRSAACVCLASDCLTHILSLSEMRFPSK